MTGRTEEWKYGVVDLTQDTSTTVSDIGAVVRGVYVNEDLSAHPVEIKDGSDTVFIVKASLSAGSFVDLIGTVFDSSVVVDPDDSATGNITVLYRRLGPY